MQDDNTTQKSDSIVADFNIGDIETNKPHVSDVIDSQDSTTHDLDSIDKDMDLDNLELSQDNELNTRFRFHR